MSTLLGNPHSASSSSQLSTRRIEDVRLRVLQFFNADPDDFDLVFVANATAGIKLVMESFREQENGFWYGYHKDSHTSLVGVREAAKAGHHCFMSDTEVDEWLRRQEHPETVTGAGTMGLFAYPVQSNMNGRRLPLSWTSQLRSSKHKYYSLLDVASFVSTSPLDLSNASEAPDFTVLSFYKIFGFPDLGALVVRKASASVLQRRQYFGGGTVEMVTCGKENWHIQKHGRIHEQLEDGTLPIHSIIALDSALNVHKRLFGTLEQVASHTGFLAEQLYSRLVALRHANNDEVCKIYKDPLSSYTDGRKQGPIIAFNLRNCQGDWVSNTEVEKLANIQNIQLRSGGLCNPGGIASSLELEPWETKRNFSAGYRCGNENDIIGGKPTGMLRVSFGAMSNMVDLDTFIDFVEEFFVDRQDVQEPHGFPSPDRDLYIETLTVYPIKSCGGWSIPPDAPWDVRPEGLAWDREWCLVHQGTRTALSQKKYPKMALLRPSLELDRGLLRLRYHGAIPPATPTEISVPLSADPSVFQHSENGASTPCSQVCGEDIMAQTYASKEITDFFTNVIGTPCTLARFPAVADDQSTRHSKAHLNVTSENQLEITKRRPILLSNESPILTISRSSLNRLNEQIKAKEGKAAHASVFRANIIVAEDPASSPGLEQPYVEDSWRSLQIDRDVSLDVLGGCRRCQMVCVDQKSAEKNAEPFVTLAKTRRREGKVFFGVHAALADAKEGRVARIKVGDSVHALT
jgi:molybdenum cofactor sulfurtransferase